MNHIMAEKCKECGCECANCTQENQRQSDMHLHVEIENLRQCLLEKDNHIVTMETQFLNEADKFPNGELASMKEELLIWQEKYSRLHEAHKRVQKVNQNLEDKLLRIVDKCETEKGAFTKDIATLSHRLADANYTIHRLTQDNEKYRNDVNLAIQLLQCKPSYFVGQKYDSLPSEVQAKVRTYVAQKRRSSDVTSSDVKSITVPISTFPPTAMVYNVTKPSTVEKHSDDDEDKSKPPVDVVSAAIMAKVLEDREKDRIFAKHCDTCTCHRSILTVDAETQTNISDNPFCDECATKCTKYMMHTVSSEINENTINGKVQSNNTSCTKHTNCQSLCAKDKFVSKNNRTIGSLKDDNLNKKNLIHRSDVPIQVQDLSENINKQMTFQKINDTCNVARINSEKVKHIKASKKSDNYADSKSNTNYWNKLEKLSNHNQTAFEFPEKHATRKEQTHIDIINDRLWKNEWTKLKSEANLKDTKNKNKINNDVEIDIINDRDWKNDRSELRNPTQLTLIEVKNLDNINQNDSGQTDIATSPSFSSDSIVISTSDPSSSSSDVVQSITGTQLTQNINNLKSNFQNRLTGPRNCLVRVTPGSKNILLDNAGHYKTVLYTSGTNKPNTALVHSKKLSRFGSERSISTSSEENSPILLQDNNQLQRVAEWVQSSVCIESGVTNDNNKLRSSENVMNEGSSLVYINESESNCKIQVDDEMSSCAVKKIIYDQSVRNVEVSKQKDISCDTNNLSSSSDIDYLAEEKDKDLITFDVSNEEEKTHKSLNKSDSKDLNYEVKITKEMEETYLKLAASLDPVALNLSSSNNADLTIEKYRKDHKRLHIQKIQDRAGSKT